MLLGREEERLALERVLAQARRGTSGVLALVGEPGIGKTALLEHAIAVAGDMRALRARGIESEAAVPFAALSELLRPALGALDRIPAPQSAALSSALALAPAAAQDRFATGAAALSLLSAYADDGPLLLVVDDAHLLDPSSAEALLFAARRLVADPIAVLLAVREGEPSLLDGSDLRTLRIAGLGRSHAEQLLAPGGVSADGIARLYRATGGNPLALLELAPEAGRLVATPEGAPVPISASIGSAFTRRADTLPVSVRRLLVLAAASESGEIPILARAATALGLDVEELTAAEDEGLVTIDAGVLEFRHPLARSALYAAAAPTDRREVHAAIAAALPDRDADQRAWHLAAASVGPDDSAAAALEQAGARARARSAYAVAASAFERAAGLASADGERARLLFEAADAAWLSGDQERTVDLLARARMTGGDTRLSARIDQLAGLVTMQRGPVMEGCRLLVSGAGRIEASDPELAVLMLGEAVRAGFYAGDTATMVATAERAVGLASGNGSATAACVAAMAQGIAAVADGRGDAGAIALHRAIAILEQSEELRAAPHMLGWVSVGPLWLREVGTGRDLLERALVQVRELGAVGLLPGLLHHFARDQATTDQWPAAEASYDEAIRLARETGQRTELTAALAGLTWLEARQGREELCRAHAAEAWALCEELGMGTYQVWTAQALGDLELALARPAEALGHYLDQARTLSERGIADVDLSPGPELVEIHLRMGDDAAAGRAAIEYVRRAEDKGQPWALARAARCRGLIASPEEMESRFAEALALHAQTPDVFETARTRLAFGARLRRARQRVRAREELRAALEAFDALGSAPWAEQANAELAATGERARRRDPSTLDDLTPQELQIAGLLAEGKTTREAAAAVFLSPKTIEYHLRSVYRKLGIHSREELARALGTGA